jgi:periplasmic protein TonB
MSKTSTTLSTEAGNRLGSTLFLMALAHGVVILGVTFTSNIGESLDPSTLKVTLVTPRTQEPPADAEFLANQSQSGSGDPFDSPRPTTVVSTFELANIEGDERAADLRDATTLEANEAAEQLVTSRASDSAASADPTAKSAESVRQERATLMQSAPERQSLAAVVDLSAQLPASENREDVPGPDTRQSILAGYLNTWRERVERIGTLNFPRQFLVGNTATRRPRLEVAIGPDGSLRDIIVQSSSGDRAVDQAAVSILRLAAPFEPLPPEILAEYETLRFAYEWDFIQADR